MTLNTLILFAEWELKREGRGLPPLPSAWDARAGGVAVSAALRVRG